VLVAEAKREIESHLLGIARQIYADAASAGGNGRADQPSELLQEVRRTASENVSARDHDLPEQAGRRLRALLTVTCNRRTWLRDPDRSKTH
jgi:hypothetical protein